MTSMLNGLCLRPSHFFGVLIIVMDIKLGKTILKISLVISPWQLRKNAAMSDLSWMEKLIIGEQITIGYVNIGLSYKAFVILGMLYPFIHLSQIAECWARARAWESTNHRSLHCKGRGRSSAFIHYRTWSWWARVRSCCWVNIIARKNSSAHRSRRSPCRDFFRSPSRAYRGIIVIFTSYEGSTISKITRHIRPFTNFL